MSGPRRRKFVGPTVSRVTWHGGRGTPYLRRWALIIALVRVPGVRAVILDCKAIHGVERPQPAHHDLDHAHQEAGEHDEKAERKDQRPVRRWRPVDSGDIGGAL